MDGIFWDKGGSSQTDRKKVNAGLAFLCENVPNGKPIESAMGMGDIFCIWVKLIHLSISQRSAFWSVGEVW